RLLDPADEVELDAYVEDASPQAHGGVAAIRIVGGGRSGDGGDEIRLSPILEDDAPLANRVRGDTGGAVSGADQEAVPGEPETIQVRLGGLRDGALRSVRTRCREAGVRVLQPVQVQVEEGGPDLGGGLSLEALAVGAGTGELQRLGIAGVLRGGVGPPQIRVPGE